MTNAEKIEQSRIGQIIELDDDAYPPLAIDTLYVIGGGPVKQGRWKRVRYNNHRPSKMFGVKLTKESQMKWFVLVE